MRLFFQAYACGSFRAGDFDCIVPRRAQVESAQRFRFRGFRKETTWTTEQWALLYFNVRPHRGYSTPKWLEYFIATCGTLALQGGPIYWVAVHRMHHRYTDKEGDPHSPRDGKWWSHMGWILNGSLRNKSKMLKQYAPDLAREITMCG